ncbi:unnamed protein product [Penicillium olsonii]|nr:unnamed protein product [Penicillium olsonii]
MPGLPDGLISFGPGANCTLDLCPLEASILRYQPSLPATYAPIAIFAISLLWNVFNGTYNCSWGFMASLIGGCILEIVGYVGRIIIHDNPFDFNGFIMQISSSTISSMPSDSNNPKVCITVAPVFFCAAIYVLLTQTILHIDERVSRFKARYFSWIFISCDIVSLILQAVGGALSCIGSTKLKIQVGVDVSLAGLIFQVATLSLFTLLFLDYLHSCWKLYNGMVFTRRMNVFLFFLTLSTILILIRCVYRIVELHAGYFSPLFRDEPLFIALESG